MSITSKSHSRNSRPSLLSEWLARRRSRGTQKREDGSTYRAIYKSKQREMGSMTQRSGTNIIEMSETEVCLFIRIVWGQLGEIGTSRYCHTDRNPEKLFASGISYKCHVQRQRRGGWEKGATTPKQNTMKKEPPLPRRERHSARTIRRRWLLQIVQ